jgi:hypothetical protein
VTDNSMLLKVGLFGGAAFVAYKQGWLSFLGLNPSGVTATSTPATPAQPQPAPAPAPAPAPSPFKASGVNSLDAVFAALNKYAPGASQTADGWNWDLMQIVPGFTAPDPSPLFSAAPFDPPWTRDFKMPLVSYWIVMGNFLRQKQGLSGMGHYGNVSTGLAAIARHYRRAS